jgi:hypothetical protein
MKIQLIAVFLLLPGGVSISGCANEAASEPRAETEHDHSDDGTADHNHSSENQLPPVPSKQAPWPSAIAEEKTFDFGTMPVGGENEHAFAIRNEGDADLQLLAGEPTCKCTAFELSETTIKPGEEGTLLVRWAGKAKDDSFQHGGPVYTNDPKRQEIRFVVKGIVDTDFDVFPAQVWPISNVSPKTGGAMQAVVVSRIYKEFNITDLVCESQYISTAISPAPQQALDEFQGISGYMINVKLSPEIPPGLMEESLTLTLDRADAPIEVMLRAHMAGPIRILPTPGVTFDSMVNGLKLGQFPTNKGRQVELTLLVDTSDMTESFTATSVDTSPGFIKAELVPAGQLAGGRSRYKLVVSVPPGIPRTERTRSSPGLVEMQTNHPSGQAIRIKLSFKAF